MNAVHKDGLQKCGRCDQMFDDAIAFENHKKACYYACQFCDRLYTKREILDTHVRKSHVNEQKTERCPGCDEMWPISKLKNHKKSCLALKTCSYCQLVLPTKTALEEHVVRQHTHDWRVRCDICNRSGLFRFKVNLLFK